MAIDPYSACPGGTGKKVKFCCPDLVSELDKISRMLEGDQPQACLDHVETLEKKYPARACLCTIKASLQSELGQDDAARQTVDTLLKTQPDNPVALADSALFAADQQGAAAGVSKLQRALAACGEQILPQIYMTIGELASRLLGAGHYLAARQHFLLQLRMNPQDQRVIETVVRMSAPREVPLLFKDDARLWPAPDAGDWKTEFDEANKLAQGIKWLDAEQKFAALSVKAPHSAAVWHNLALVRGWLADEAGMRDALRRLAALDAPREVPLDDAIEAEALAQLTDPVVLGDTTDELVVTYPISDIEKLASHLASDKRVKGAPLQSAHTDPNAPPPRSVYWLLDRALPETGKDLPLDGVPNILATLAVFGKETDREARVELECYRSDMRAAGDQLVAIAGDSVGVRKSDEVFNKVQANQIILSWNWRLPDDTPSEHVENLITQQRRTTVLNRWPKAPQAVLGGKTPEEASREPALRAPLSACVLLLELALDHPTAPALVNELRGRLGLSVAHPIDPTAVNVKELSLVRLVRLQFDKISDDDLVFVYRRATMAVARLAARKAALEILARPSLEGKVEKAGVYGTLARLEEDSLKACEYLSQAREAAEAAKQSGAMWALDELTLRINRGEVTEASALMQHLNTHYGRDPYVRSALGQILMQMGLIGPDGRPTQGAAPGSAQVEQSGVMIAPTAGAESGKIWTPGGDASAGGKKKPAIWTPD